MTNTKYLFKSQTRKKGNVYISKPTSKVKFQNEQALFSYISTDQNHLKTNIAIKTNCQCPYNWRIGCTKTDIFEKMQNLELI